jgi:hypothetical protein
MSRYITVDDIKSNIVAGFELQSYLDESDEEVQDLAERLGVRDPSDIKVPLHYKIRRYAVVYTIMRLCQDKIGTNNIELPEYEKYLVQYQMYKKELEELRGQISIEMLIGQVNEIRDRAVNTGTIFRG